MGEDWSGLYIGRGTTDITADYRRLYRGERYIDPWWGCVIDKSIQERQIRYLIDTPSNGPARVAAMRARIESLGKFDVGAPLRSMQKSSADTFMDVASDIERSLGSAEGRKGLAERLGVPVSAIDLRKNDLLAAFVGNPQVRVLLDRLLGVIGPQLISGVRNAISAIAGASSALKGFSSAMTAAPFIGAMISMVVDMVVTAKEQEAAANRAACTENAQRIETVMKSLAANRWPFQWHWEPFGEIGCNVPASQAGINAQHQWELAQRLGEWWYEFEAIGKDLAYRSSVKEWWATAATYMSDDRVLDVFNAFGRDDWAGRMAGDEQVMLVAAPIAVANGFDVDTFAAALWDRSKGWSSANPGLLRADDVRQDKLKCPGALSAGKCVSTGEVHVQCGPGVRNALYVQYAVLARDALVLAEEWRTRPSPATTKPIMPSVGSKLTSTGSNGWGGVALAALGAVGSSALWYFKAPIALVAAPVGLGLAAWYAASRPRSTVTIAPTPIHASTAAMLSSRMSKLGVTGFATVASVEYPAWRAAR